MVAQKRKQVWTDKDSSAKIFNYNGSKVAQVRETDTAMVASHF